NRQEAGAAATRGAIYRSLARLGSHREQAALAAFDAARRTRVGWAHLCDAPAASAGNTHPSGPAARESYPFPCRAPILNGECRLAIDGNGLWLLRKQGRGFGPPALAYRITKQTGYAPRIEAAERTGGTRLTLRGQQFQDRASEHAPWSTQIDLERVFADRDGDGVSDGTEALLGTDPTRADSDGDGMRDGEDATPLAGPPRSAKAAVVGEVIRYANAFLRESADSTLMLVMVDRDLVAQVSEPGVLVEYRERGGSS